MLEALKARIRHGYQAIPDIRKAKVLDTSRGFPVVAGEIAPSAVKLCTGVCPAGAISPCGKSVSIDMGRCTFCGDCERAAPGAVRFTPAHRLAADSLSKLVVRPGMTARDYELAAVETREAIRRAFGRSLKLRQVSAGGCGACEMELNASGNVNFDMGRFGIEFTASPRHADGIVVTGPVSAGMSNALWDTYRSVPSPKIVIAAGACAISGGVFRDSPALDRSFFGEVKIDLYIPGCPPHPLTIINGILDLIGRK